MFSPLSVFNSIQLMFTDHCLDPKAGTVLWREHKESQLIVKSIRNTRHSGTHSVWCPSWRVLKMAWEAERLDQELDDEIKGSQLENSWCVVGMSCRWDVGMRNSHATILHQMNTQKIFRFQHELWEHQQESLLSGRVNTNRPYCSQHVYQSRVSKRMACGGHNYQKFLEKPKCLGPIQHLQNQNLWLEPGILDTEVFQVIPENNTGWGKQVGGQAEGSGEEE